MAPPACPGLASSPQEMSTNKDQALQATRFREHDERSGAF